MTIAVEPGTQITAAIRVTRRLARSTFTAITRHRASTPAAPERRDSAPAHSTTAASATPATGARTHRVEAGETAASIAITYGLSAASLLVRNGMRLRDEPATGQVLIVERGTGACREAAPLDPVDVQHHEVVAGECIDRLCERFGVSRRILLTANGLSSESCVTPGVILVVPTSTDPRDTGEIPVVSVPANGVSRHAS